MNIAKTLFLVVGISLFSSGKVLAQSAEQLFDWVGNGVMKEHLIQYHNNFLAYKVPSLSDAAQNGWYRVKEDENIWEGIKKNITIGRFDEVAVLFVHARENNISPENPKDLAKSFKEYGDTIANRRKCRLGTMAGFPREEILIYKVAAYLDSSINISDSFYNLADYCFNNLVSFDEGVILYAYGLYFNPESERYLALNSKLFANHLFHSLVISSSNKVITLENKPITMAFPSINSVKVTSNSQALAFAYNAHLVMGNNIDSSLKLFDLSIEKDPNLYFAYNGLGKVKILQNNLEEAQEFIEKAIRLNPNYADAHNSLGNLFIKQENLQQAVDAYRKALSIKSNHSLYITNLAEAERQLALANQIEPKLDDSVKRSVVLIETYEINEESKKEKRNTGTGWIVNNSNNQALIVTNRHIFEKFKDIIEVKLHDDPSTSLPAEIFKISNNDDEDIAILKVSGVPTNIKPLSISSTESKDNDTIFVLGHPYQAREWTPVTGKIGAVVHPNQHILTGLLQLDITIDRGNSGSPVLNKNNEVIGLITSESNDKARAATGSFGYAYPISFIKEKLTLWGIDYESK